MYSNVSTLGAYGDMSVSWRRTECSWRHVSITEEDRGEQGTYGDMSVSWRTEEDRVLELLWYLHAMLRKLSCKFVKNLRLELAYP